MLHSFQLSSGMPRRIDCLGNNGMTMAAASLNTWHLCSSALLQSHKGNRRTYQTTLRERSRRYHMHPATLDASAQSLVHHTWPHAAPFLARQASRNWTEIGSDANMEDALLRRQNCMVLSIAATLELYDSKPVSFSIGHCR